MKQITSIIIIITLMMVISVNAGINLTSYKYICYQETANIATLCGGLNTGTYSYYGDGSCSTSDFKNAIDGNQNTFCTINNIIADGIFYVNYTIPQNTITANWSSTSTIDFMYMQYNIICPVIPTCLNYSTNLNLRLDRIFDSTNTIIVRQCYNGSWVNLTNCNYANNYTLPKTSDMAMYEDYINWQFYDLNENSQNFNNITFTGNNETFSINLTYNNINYSSINVTLVYNNTNYQTSPSGSSGNQLFTSIITVPTVTTQTNKIFYYIIGLTNTTGTYYYNSTSNNQTINYGLLTTNCAGNYNFLNITNYDEENLDNINGTIEYILSLQDSNNLISSINGNVTGTNITICSNVNLSNSYANYNLQLRYYGTNYSYKTYNIQNSAITNIPININLYYLLGTQFKINYVDFNYLTYPGAIIQIQRQYLSQGLYNTVEIPKFDNNGQTTGTFNTNNIRYKLIVINNGVVLDTFNDIFPSCQNIILGTCEINLRGAQATQTSTTGDFTYTLVKSNSSITLTYIIPSGTPRSIEFITNQNSRFLDNINVCDTTLFSSGGTITCTYNQTVGDSIISTQIINSDGSHLYGSIQISEDLGSFFLLNNYFIAFVLILLLALIFISSGVVLVIIGVVGLIFLGLIFLIKGFDFTTIIGSIAFLIIGAVIIIFKISQKEETT